MRPHDWFIEQRIDYATRALDQDDLETFAAHLRHCAECEAEVHRIERDLAWLPMALEPVPPRPGLRRRIIQQVLEGNDAKRRHWLPLALAASLLLAVAGWYSGSAGAGEIRTELARQTARVSALEDTLAIMHRAGRVLQANVEMDSQRGGLIIFADEVSHRWNVVLHGLPPAPPGRQYQFWFICSDGMVRGAEIRLSRAGPEMFTTGMPEGGGTVLGAALTLEPLDASDGPPRGPQLAHLML